MTPEPNPTVYSWYMPEIARAVADFARKDYPTEVFRQNYHPGLDTLHDSLLGDYLKISLPHVFTEESLHDWEQHLPHGYYTNGSSEGIFHLIARHKTYFPKVPLYQFEGEYHGYEEYAKALGVTLVNVPYGHDLDSLVKGVFFVSAPASVDGNIVKNSVIERITKRHYVIIDTAYAGMTPDPTDKLVINDHVAAVVGSMSKPFGLYYHRIGFLWSKDPVRSLYGNKWFKNAFSIQLAKWIYDLFDPYDLALTYRDWQHRACQEASEQLGYSIMPSDVWLLGYVLPNAQDGLPHSLGPFQRGPGYRLCLTPYYMSYEQETIHS